MTEEDIRTACAVLGTLEYVDATLPQLVETLRVHVSPDHHHQLDFDDEQDGIGGITSGIYSDSRNRAR